GGQRRHPLPGPSRQRRRGRPPGPRQVETTRGRYGPRGGRQGRRRDRQGEEEGGAMARARTAAGFLGVTLLLAGTGPASWGQNAAWALGRIGPRLGRPAVTDLCQALSDRDPSVRRDVAGALGEMQGEARSAAPLLLRRFRDDDDPTVRKSALTALVNVVGPED